MQKSIDTGGSACLNVLDTPPLTDAAFPDSGAGDLAIGPSFNLQTEESSTDAGLNFRAVAGDWYAVHIQGRREKTFADKMRALSLENERNDGMGFFVYLPLRQLRFRVRRREAGRRHEFRWEQTEEPFFKNYAFVAGGDAVVYAAKATNLAYGLIHEKNPRLLVEGLERLQQALSFQPTAKETRGQIVGRKCLVVEWHPLGGKVGIVSEKNGKFYIPLNIFGRSVETEIAAEYLTPLDDWD